MVRKILFPAGSFVIVAREDEHRLYGTWHKGTSDNDRDWYGGWETHKNVANIVSGFWVLISSSPLKPIKYLKKHKIKTDYGHNN